MEEEENEGKKTTQELNHLKQQLMWFNDTFQRVFSFNTKNTFIVHNYEANRFFSLFALLESLLCQSED